MKKLIAIICAVLIVSSAVVSVSAANTGDLTNANEPAETHDVGTDDSGDEQGGGDKQDSGDKQGGGDKQDSDDEQGGDDEQDSEDEKQEDEIKPADAEPYTDEAEVAEDFTGDFTVSGGDYSYDEATGVLTILGGDVTISGTTNTDRIKVTGAANITLSSVNIDASGQRAPAFEIMAGSGGSVTITLVGENTLTSGTVNVSFSDYGFAGLQNNCVPVTITGSGNLIATGGYGTNGGGGAGIGGGYGGSDGTKITISGSGTVTATGDDGAAGIGGAGWQSKGEDITINGSGTVIAKGGTNGGAGIGGGNGGNGNRITISMSGNGNVTAIGGHGGGAGIGGGKNSGNGTNIIISGSGTVEAEADSGAGIGGGDGGNGETIIISGTVNVKASAGQNSNDSSYGSFGGAGIGGGKGGKGTDITISMSGSGKVEAIGGKSGGAGIGGGKGGSGDDIKISGSGTIIATGGSWPDNGYYEGNSAGAGIGGGNGGNGTGITISGSVKVEATGGSHYHYGDTYSAAGIGGGNGGNGEGININGGTVTATGGECGGAGIGGGKNGSGGTITISGGTVTATAGSYSDSVGGGAGIGSGNGSSGGSNITISGGQVTATSDIGPGIGGEGSTVTIVSIKGESDTSYPWVVTNEIESTNEADDYRGIVFDEAHKDEYDGIVYGTVKLTAPYTIEAGKTLRVHKNAKLITDKNLKLKGTLYLEADEDDENVYAQLENWYDITIEGEGKIQHEAQSVYEWYGSEKYDFVTTDNYEKLYKKDGKEGLYICSFCGTSEPHNPILGDGGAWKSNSTHHWHIGSCDFEDEYDCSVDRNAIDKCSYMVHIENEGEEEYVLDYGPHRYNDEPDKEEDGKLYYYCKDCQYERIENKPAVTPPPVTEPTVTEPPVTEPTETTAPTETTVPSGGNRPSYYPPVTTTVTTTYTETVNYPNDYTGEDISAEAGCYEADNNGVNVIPPIILIVITAVSAFVLYRREKK